MNGQRNFGGLSAGLCFLLKGAWLSYKAVNRRIHNQKYTLFVGFEVLTAAVMKITIFWDIMPCSPLKVNRRVGGTSRLSSACHPLSPWFLARLIFLP
jgi:hypothetical protein